jgi:hypothetical protein
MLLVIFGAGASYDSSPAYPPGSSYPSSSGGEDRPPLADHLFDNRLLFAVALDHYPQCHAIVPYLRHAGVRVEQELERLTNEAIGGDAERHRQLAAVRFYLRESLSLCGRHWNAVNHGITTYKTLADQVRHHRKDGERVCFVTFNYDTLFDDALRALGVMIEGIEHYVADSAFSFVKVHGSVDWIRRVNDAPQTAASGNQVMAEQLIQQAAHLTFSDIYIRHPETPVMLNGIAHIPAIAIPLERKQDFECPRAHIDHLAALLPSVAKVMIIGWRATDEPFMELLSHGLDRRARVLVIDSGELAATEVANRLQGRLVDVAEGSKARGFSDFVLGRFAVPFLSA